MAYELLLGFETSQWLAWPSTSLLLKLYGLLGGSNITKLKETATLGLKT
jgi:hypothetical protein